MVPGPFDPKLVRAHKARAAAGFRQAAFLHARAADDLAERLEAIPRPFMRTLALGGGGLISQALAARPYLAQRLGAVIEADIASGDLVFDPELLPFAEGAFDLIVSPLTMHWVNDLPGVLVQLRMALKPDGLMLASLLGGETLHELRLSLLQAETEITGGAGPRVAPFADLRELGALLQRAGFALPVTDVDRITVRYASPMALMQDLRRMGATNALTERRRKPLRRATLMRMIEIYGERFADADGRVRATFEIVWLSGWAPHDSQQQPLKPGSAQQRLADALGAKEQSAGEKAKR